MRSFIETVDERRARQAAIKRAAGKSASACLPATAADHPLPDPYPRQVHVKADRRIKTILVPNTSHAFSLLMSASFARQGAQAVSLDIGRERAIELGETIRP